LAISLRMEMTAFSSRSIAFMAMLLPRDYGGVIPADRTCALAVRAVWKGNVEHSCDPENRGALPLVAVCI
jgi:hypothetical protein